MALQRWLKPNVSFREVGGGFLSECQRRFFSRERAENVRKINPRMPQMEASSIARDLYGILKPLSPFTISTAWLQAQESGVSGLSSKTHMKLMLKWMRGRKMLKLWCEQVGSTKKFMLSTLPEDPNAVSLRLETQKKNALVPKSNKRRPVKGKKKTK